jgi:hypothetical protein
MFNGFILSQIERIYQWLAGVIKSVGRWVGRDGALRCPRRDQRRNAHLSSRAIEHSFRPLNAGGDIAARHS